MDAHIMADDPYITPQGETGWMDLDPADIPPPAIVYQSTKNHQV